MAEPTPRKKGKGKVTTISGFQVDDTKTLEENLAQLQAARINQENVVAKLQEAKMKEAVQKQTEMKKQAINDLYAMEAELSLATNGRVTELSEKQKKKYINDQYKTQVKEEIKLLKETGVLKTKETKKQRIQDLRNSAKDNRELYKDLKKLKKENGGVLTDEQEAVMKQAKKDSLAGGAMNALIKGLGKLQDAVDGLGNVINQGISTYSKYQTGINARLQGSRGSTVDIFTEVESNLTKKVGITPYFKTETMLDNLSALVEDGIAANIEQRAFLQTAKDSIATTFDAANSSLLRIIRLQQSDSTAARLGMEAYLTQYLNELTQNTEYLKSTFDSVEAALLEASSQMSADASAEFEYIVQKWLGTLTGTGLSDTTANNIATAVGYLGSGDITNLSNSNVYNLMVMSATRAGLDVGKILSDGLDAGTTNKLLYSMANYLADLSDNSSNVVKSQLAETFGVTISDLTAASQLSSSFNTIAQNLLSYSGMYDELSSQMGKLIERTSISSLINNMMDNMKFSLAENIASNPALSATWQITDLIQGVTGGINIPFVTAMGSGFDLNTTVENLMKLGMVGVSTFSMIGDLISSVGNISDPTGILSSLDIGYGSSSSSISRGTGLKARSAGLSVSQSTFVGNSSSSDIYDTTMNAAEDSANAKVETATKEQEEDNVVYKINDYLQETFEAHMSEIDKRIRSIDDRINSIVQVEVSNYGLVGIN